MEDEDEDDVVTDDGDFGSVNAWLLKHMPSLPHFDSVRYQTSLALRQASCLSQGDVFCYRRKLPSVDYKMEFYFGNSDEL